jgi:hypothetical protein
MASFPDATRPLTPIWPVLGSRQKNPTREEIDAARKQAKPPMMYDRLTPLPTVNPRAETSAEKTARESRTAEAIESVRAGNPIG